MSIDAALHPIFNFDVFEASEVLDVDRDKNQFVDMRDGGDLPVDEWSRSTESVEPCAFAPMPVRRSLVVSEHGKRRQHDVLKISLYCCPAFPTGEALASVGEFVPDGRCDRALLTMGVKAPYDFRAGCPGYG